MKLQKFLHSLKYAGAEELPEYDLKRGICIGVNTMCLSMFILNLISGLIFYLLSKNLSIIVGAYLEALFLLGIIGINKRKHFDLANASFYTIIIFATFYFSAILGKSSETQLMILFILGLIFFLFDKTKIKLICIGIALLLLVVLELNYSILFIKPAAFTTQVTLYVRWLVYGVVISLVLLIFYLYQKNTGLFIQLHTYSKKIRASLTSEERLNELKNLFFQSISHDILGTYHTVGSICTTIHDKIETNQPVNIEAADALIDASEHYKFLLRNFLEFSKFKNASFDNINLESFDLIKEVERIVEINKYIANQKDVQIEILSSFGFPEHILGDRLKTTRIIYNLFSNALKFTRNNSKIVIHLQYNNDFWMISVTDQGKGIKGEHLTKIFEPYITERTVHNPEGIGLGLHIVNYLCEILGAKITVNSEVNKGTSFVVTVPLQNQLVT